MDSIDAQILEILQDNGRITNSDLAKRVGLSAPSVLERVRKLEEAGVILGYSAKVNPEKVGRGTSCFVAISLALHQQQSIETFLRQIEDIPEVLECHHITGEEDYLLRVAVHDMQHYRNLLLNSITKIPGLSKIKTMVVLSQMKMETRLEVDESLINNSDTGRPRSRNQRARRPK
jgi:Lrp/AsnC family leucine-responsive transcriptional regulator